MSKYDSSSDEESFSTHEGETKIFQLSKKESELFLEENYVPQKIINIKRKFSKKNEHWLILENNKVVLELKGSRFTKKEKIFLSSIDGMKFLMSEYKNGNKSIAKLKLKLKEIIK